MADWTKPTLSSTYANYLSETTGRDVDCAVQFSTGTITSPPTGAVKWDTSLNRWQKWSGTAWGELATTYAFTGVSATSLNVTGNTTLGDAAADTTTHNGNTLSFPNGATISGTLSFSGAVTFAANTTFGDAAGDTVTFVANTAVLPAAGMTFSTGVANFSAGLQSAGVAVLTAASTATLTNKTFDTAGAGNVLKVNGNTLTATAGTGTITFPNVTDTVVTLAATQTLTNKTLTSISVTSTVIETGNPSTAAAVGFRGVPLSSNATATLALNDAGKFLYVSANQTIPANASVAFPVGTSIVVVNSSATAITIAITTDTMRQAGTTNTGTRTVAGYGMATLLKVAATSWVISGSGIT